MKIAVRVLSAVLAMSLGAGGVALAGAGKTKPGTAVGGKRVVKTGGDSRAWTTLRPLLPESIVLAGQVNVATLRGSDTFKQLRRLAEKDHDTSDIIGAFRSGCDVDLSEVVQDIAFAVTEGSDNQMLVALSFKGVGEADLLRCGEAAVTKKLNKGTPVKIEAKHTGAIVEYSVAGEREHVFASWLAPDVVAFASDPTDRAQLERLIGGKGGWAGAATTRRGFGALLPGAAAWLVYVKAEHVDSYDLKLAAASANLSGGQLQLDLSLFLADADSAKKAAADWTAQRDQLATGGRGVPPLVGQLVKAVQIVPADDVVHVTLAVPEKDFLSFFSLF